MAASWDKISHDIEQIFEEQRLERVNMPDVEQEYDKPQIYSAAKTPMCHLCIQSIGSPFCDYCQVCTDHFLNNERCDICKIYRQDEQKWDMRDWQQASRTSLVACALWYIKLYPNYSWDTQLFVGEHRQYLIILVVDNFSCMTLTLVSFLFLLTGLLVTVGWVLL